MHVELIFFFCGEGEGPLLLLVSTHLIMSLDENDALKHMCLNAWSSMMELFGKG